MERFGCVIIAVIFLTLISSRIAVSVTTLQCDSLQQLCPNDDQPRMCVCNSTEAMLRWRTSVTGASLVLFDSNSMVGSTGSFGGGFSGNLTMNNSGFISTLTFNPSTVRSAGSGGVVAVLCDDLSSIAATADITVTSADVPGTRQLMIVNIGCDPTNTSYQTTLQWNANDTGGPGVSILYYLVEVTSPSGFMCLPEQCNVTANTTTITGLSCSTDYSFTVRAVNCIGTSNVSMPLTTSRIATPAVDQACFVNGAIRVTLQDYNTGNGNCMAVNNFNISSSCTGDLINTDYGPGDTVANLSAADVSPSDSCVVTVIAVADCGDSEPATITTNKDCFPTSPSTMMPTSSMSSPSPSMTTSDNPSTTLTPPSAPATMGIGGAAGGAGGAVAAIGAAAIVMATIFVCMFCPCGCCMPCRRMCCGCCPEEKICYRWGSEYDESAPVPCVEKQPVLKSYSKETKEKDVETGQPSYPAGPMYQDPSTIQRQAAPSGDLYAQPEKPARHQKQKPAIEMPTYQDPNTIQRQAAPTGDLYAQPDKPPKQPPGPAPVYSQVEKPQPSGLVYADLSHSVAPPDARRPAPVQDTTYAEVRESRP